MPLPDDGKIWPPEAARPMLRDIREWSAWWSGDPEQLMGIYGHTIGGQSLGPTPNRSSFRRFWERIAGGLFGSQQAPDRQRAYLHVPLAGDMASTSSALLFSEPAGIQVAEAHGESAPAAAKAAEEELQRIRAEGGLDAGLLEGADVAAGLGGVYLKPTWDEELIDVPLLAVVQPDQALPEFRHGILTAVTLWREVERDDRDVLRHVERHEVAENGRGVVLHGLYRGDNDKLGYRMDEEELLLKTKLTPLVDLPFAGLGVHYVPNLRPNRRRRGSPIGQSDYAGAEGMLDALDEAYASWMRDIRLGKARLLVGRDMLDSAGRFDLDHEVYNPLDVGNSTAGTPMKDQVVAQQFEIRYEAHAATCLALVERIVSGPYSPQTFGLHPDGGAESGKALNIRERRTYMTQQRKAAWWTAAIGASCEQLLAISREVFGTGVSVYRPRVELADGIAVDEVAMATTIEILNRAEAASRQTLIKMQHPDWGKEEVAAEVDRILAEKGLSVLSPELA